MSTENARHIPKWSEYFMNLLGPISARSKDPNTQVGCLIAGPENNIISTGYNSFPRGIDDTRTERLERPEKYFWMEHGDRNAIYAVARRTLQGTTMYLTGMPCMDCARAIVQVGIAEEVFDKERHDAWACTTPKYADDFKRVEQLFWEAKVVLTGWRQDAKR